MAGINLNMQERILLVISIKKSDILYSNEFLMLVSCVLFRTQVLILWSKGPPLRVSEYNLTEKNEIV